MKDNRKAMPIIKGEKGVTAVLTALFLVMLLGFGALAVDIGYGMLTKNELQNIADAAALAAARQLGTIYQSMPTPAAQAAFVVDSAYETQIKDAAINVASQNKAGGINSIVVSAGDIFIGKWSPWNETNSQPNAVRVIARRDSLANGPIATFFAKIFGMSGRNVTALATAALTGQSTSDPGELELPVGISRWFFDEDWCDERIAFSPSNSPESCAGWTSWEYNSNASIMKKILNEHPNFGSPGTTAYESIFNFIGGDLASIFGPTLSLFQRKGYDIDINGDPILDGNGDPVTDAGASGVPLCRNVNYNKDTNPRCSVPCDATNTERLHYPVWPPPPPPDPLVIPDPNLPPVLGEPRNLHEWPTMVVVYENDDGYADCSNPNQDKRIVGFARITVDDICGPPSNVVRGVVECNYVEPTDSRGGGGSYGLLGSIPGLVE